MSELTKELEQDKAFIEKVANRIYSDADDIEGVMSEPEWICKMTDIADKYITRFEASYNFANNLADELLASNIQLNDDQKVVLEWLKEEKTNSNLTAFDCIYSFIYGNPKGLITQIWSELNAKEEAQLLEVFSQWVQEQEEIK